MCARLCARIYFSMCAYVNVLMHAHVCLYVCVCARMRVHMRAHVTVCASLYVCICVCVHMPELVEDRGRYLVSLLKR